MTKEQDQVIDAICIIKYNGDCTHARVHYSENMFCGICPILRKCMLLHRGEARFDKTAVNHNKCIAAEELIINSFDALLG